MVCALDMVSGLCEALGSSVDSLIGNSNYMQILVQACVDPHPEVKQAAFASVGDIAKYCMPHLIPCLDQVRYKTLSTLGQIQQLKFAFLCSDFTENGRAAEAKNPICIRPQ
jgi:transportin-1